MDAKKKQRDDALAAEVRQMVRHLSKQDRKDFFAFCEQLIADADAKRAASRNAT